MHVWPPHFPYASYATAHGLYSIHMDCIVCMISHLMIMSTCMGSQRQGLFTLCWYVTRKLFPRSVFTKMAIQSLFIPADHFWIWHKGLRLTVSVPLAQQCAHALLPTSVQELAEVMGKANAQTLYQFLHCS